MGGDEWVMIGWCVAMSMIGVMWLYDVVVRCGCVMWLFDVVV
jgi:hypothetical protein